MASFVFDGESWLAIGGVGDHRSWRTDTAIHLIREPAAEDLDPARPLQVEVGAIMRVRYLVRSRQGRDFVGEGSGAALLTYATVWWNTRALGESWGEALARRPVELRSTNLFQTEAVAVTPDGREVVFTTEGVRPPLRRLGVPHGGEREGAR
jgi:hypothetical protein